MARNPKNPVAQGRQLILPIQTYPSQSVRAGGLGRKEAVREALTQALDSCPLSREQIASEMSRLTGESLSINHLNNWTSGAKRDWRFPLEYASALLVITGDAGIVDAILEGTGMAVLDKDDQMYVEYGRLVVEEKQRQKKKRALMEKLGV